jgi:hypothetical protein
MEGLRTFGGVVADKFDDHGENFPGTPAMIALVDPPQSRRFALEILHGLKVKLIRLCNVRLRLGSFQCSRSLMTFPLHSS